MDPLSITVSILGLLGASHKVSSLLTTLVVKAKEAPRQAEDVLLEVNEINACLAQLQIFLSQSMLTSNSHAKLLMVDQIIVTLTTCVMTFSELEEIVTGLLANPPLRTSTKVRWAMKEQKISRLLLRLQSSKASLNFMLTILTCTSFEEAQTSVIHLTTLVQQVLESNEGMSRRIADMEIPSSMKRILDTEARSANQYRDCISMNTQEKPDMEEFELTDPQESSVRFSFDRDLLSSRVYARNSIRNLNTLPPSSRTPSFGHLLLSDTSLADISNFSVLSLPISYSEIWNQHHYTSEPSSATSSNVTSQRSTFRMSQHLEPSPADFCSGSIPMTDTKLQRIPGKILLLGTSLAGKTTVSRQLQHLYSGGFTNNDREEARVAILNNLVNAFQGAWLRITRSDVDFDTDGNMLLQHFEVINYFGTDSQLNDFFNPDCLEAFKKLWQHAGVRKILTSKYWPELDENVMYFMNNIDDLLNPDYILSDEDVLRGRIKTTGALALPFDINDFHCQVLDIGGARSERWKWANHYKETDYVIFVVSLPGYYQHAEDKKITQMTDSLQTFETLTKEESLRTKPIMLFLNKVDIFMQKLVEIPISKYFSDYDGGSNYSKACEYFAQLLRKLDNRKDGMLYLCLTDSTNIGSFTTTLRYLRSTVLTKNLLLQVF